MPGKKKKGAEWTKKMLFDKSPKKYREIFGEDKAGRFRKVWLFFKRIFLYEVW